jgi:hypothetical protein
MIKEEWRRTITVVLTYSGWGGAFGLSLWMTLSGRSGDDGWRLLVIVFVGIAIAAGAALGRIRLTEAILGAFRAGMDTANERLEHVAKEAVEEIKHDTNGASPGDATTKSPPPDM